MAQEDLNIRCQWHSPDRLWAAVFVRDGEEWYLEGALVGMGKDPAEAVEDLWFHAEEFVFDGYNPLHPEKIPVEDRIWLFKFYDYRGASDHMYAAIREANGGVDPYREGMSGEIR